MIMNEQIKFPWTGPRRRARGGRCWASKHAAGTWRERRRAAHLRRLILPAVQPPARRGRSVYGSTYLLPCCGLYRVDPWSTVRACKGQNPAAPTFIIRTVSMKISWTQLSKLRTTPFVLNYNSFQESWRVKNFQIWPNLYDKIIIFMIPIKYH